MGKKQNDIILQSTKWSAIAEFLARIMTPLTNIIIARALDPTQFGLVATFTLVIAFAEVFTDAGFQKYLVQHEFKERKELENSANVAFWTNLSISIVFWFTICVFKNPIAEFVGSAGHGTEIVVLSLQIPLVAFSSIQTALFRRDFKFKQLLPIRFLVSVVPLLVTVPLAFILKNCWAIVIGNLLKEAVNAVALTLKSSWRPKLFYKKAILKEMLSDTMWLMADSFMIWATAYAGTLVIGRRLDSYYLGIYKMGATTIIPYISLLYTMTAPVLFSALSRLQSNKVERDKVFLTYQHYAANVVLLLGVVVFMFRNTVTLLLLGTQWTESANILGITGLAMSITVVVAQYNSDYFRAAGKPYIALLVQTIYVAIILISLSLAVSQSFSILSIVGGSLSILYCIVSAIVMGIVFKITPITTIKNMADSLLAAISFILVSSVLSAVIGSGLINDICVGIVSCVVYLGVLLLFPANRRTYHSLPVIGKFIRE